MTNKKVIIGGVVAAAVVGAAAYVVLNKKGDSASKAEAEVDNFQPIRETPAPAPAPRAAPAAAPVATTTPAAPATAATTTVDTKKAAAEPTPALNRDFSFNTNDDNARMLEEALAEQQEAFRPTAPVSADGVVSFPHLGLKMKPLPGWIVKEELSPMPNIAMIMVTTPELMEAQQEQTEMGSVPVIIMSIEDINGENLDVEEFKDRSKQMALTQMLMMTNGMAQPRIRYDDALSVGSFTHCLEFNQSLPPYLDITVCNMIAVESRVAYVFQIMCNSKTMEQFKPVFMEMARSVVIENVGDVTIGRIDVTTTKGNVVVSAHSTWGWYPDPSSDAIAEFKTPSTVRSEQISLYEDAKAPNVANWTAKGEAKTVKGVSVATYTESRNERKVFRYNGYTAVVKPIHKSLSKIPELSVVDMLLSVKPATEKAPDRTATYVNEVHGYKFNVAQGSKIIATRVGGGTIVYAPLGVPSDSQQPAPEQEGPTVTIRFGTPETDPDCCNTIEEWKERLAIEKAAGTTSDVQEVTLAGHKCLTFISKDMQEVGPGQRLEVMGKVMIFVRNGATTLVRWESPSGLWKKFQSKLDAFMATFQFLN